MWERGARKEGKERKEGAGGCAMRRVRQSSTCGMDGGGKETERNEAGKEIGWMKEEGKNREGEGWGIGIKCFFWNHSHLKCTANCSNSKI
jgi:hypothetical protein